MTLVAITLSGCGSMKTTTEKDVIETKDISTVSNYTDSIKKTVQVINVDMTKVLALYPDLQEKNVGLGFAESVLDYLDEINYLKPIVSYSDGRKKSIRVSAQAFFFDIVD